METKRPKLRKRPNKNNWVDRVFDDPAPPSRKNRFLASSKLSERKVRQVIRCYAERKMPREAQEICGLSHVTIRRLYRYIRVRLMRVALYASPGHGAPEAVREQNRAVTMKFVREAIRPHRGVKDHNLESYYGEALFRAESTITPAQLYTLILKTVIDLGPLNRPPPPDAWPAAFFEERTRLEFDAIRRMVRAEAENREVRHGILDIFENAEDKF